MTRKTYTYWEKFWLTKCAYNADHKGSWHDEAKSRLRRLAKALKLEAGTYDIRSNMAGPAVSGEVTLHGDDVYVQVSQSTGGPSMGILFRTCEGRKDYTGGRNFFGHIFELEDLPSLAGRIDVLRTVAKASVAYNQAQNTIDQREAAEARYGFAA